MKFSWVLPAALLGAVYVVDASRCSDKEYMHLKSLVESNPESSQVSSLAYRCVCGGASTPMAQMMQEVKWDDQKCLHHNHEFHCDYEARTAVYNGGVDHCEDFFHHCVDEQLAQMAASSAFSGGNTHLYADLLGRKGIRVCNGVRLVECDYANTKLAEVEVCSKQCKMDGNRAACVDTSPSDFQPPEPVVLGNPSPELCPQSFADLGGVAACSQQAVYNNLRTHRWLIDPDNNPTQARAGVTACDNDKLRAVEIDSVGKRLQAGNPNYETPEAHFLSVCVV